MTDVHIFGTSIMQATLLDPKTQRYRFTAPQWMEKFQQQYPFHVLNHAKFGSTIEKGYRILQANLQKLRPHSIALLEYGGNDCDHGWQEVALAPKQEHHPHTPLCKFTAVFQQMIEDLRARDVLPILITLPPIDAERYFAWFTEKGRLDRAPILSWLGDIQMIYRYQELYSESVLKLSYQTHCPLVDIRSAFLDKRCYQQLLCQDGIHPNERGYQLIYQSFAEFAAHPLLKRKP